MIIALVNDMINKGRIWVKIVQNSLIDIIHLFIISFTNAMII